MASEREQFYQLLNSLLATDNAIRKAAEDQYNLATVDVRVSHLIGAISDGAVGDEIRIMATVLLRRLFSVDFDNFYANLPQELKLQFLQQIILLLQVDTNAALRRKICEVAAEVASNLIDEDRNNLWPEFLQFLFQCANSTSIQYQEIALRIFSTLPSIFGNEEQQYMQMIKQMLQKCMDSTADKEIQFQAVRAYGAFILLHEKDATILKNFSDLLHQMIRITTESVKEQNDQALVKLIVDMAETCPKFLRPQLDNIFTLCLTTLADEDIDEQWRHLILEIMVTLAENAAPMIRRHSDKYINALVPLILKMMSDVEDEESWSIQDTPKEDDSTDNNVIAESSLDRLACAIGGKALLPHILSCLPSMLSSQIWQHRYAGLMAISACGEGCHKQMEAMLNEILSGVIQYLGDSHPRVRYAACNAIGQMATDFAPSFEKKFHDQVIPGLLAVLDDVNNPRVQAHAGAALVNFSEDCPKNILTKYLNAIMIKLEHILNTKYKEMVEQGTKLVLEQVVTTIASVADTVEKEFAPYYSLLMPSLKYIIQNSMDKELRMLRGKTIECISLVGLAVGRELFLSDANEVMGLLLSTQTGDYELADDDPQTSYLISAWARMCKILGKDFEQYLPFVMGPIMKAASMKPEVALLDNEEIAELPEDDEWSYFNLGEQKNFAIRTAGMEDKASACEMLVCYARELVEGFAPFAEEVVRLMVPMLKFYFHDGVRTAAAESMPYLLNCVKVKGINYLEGMWQYICPELLGAIDSEAESTVQSELLNSLARCIETLGPNCLTEQAMTDVLQMITKQLDSHFEKGNKRQLERNEEDYDDDVEERLAEEDENDIYILSKISEVIHVLFLTNKCEFIPHFNKIALSISRLLEPVRPAADRQHGVCIFDDVIEFCGPMCSQYQSIFLQPMIEYLKDDSPEVRQASAYGCGVLAQFGGEQFSLICGEIIPLLMNLINDTHSREPENIGATENAISAVTKILKYNNLHVANKDDVLQMWYSWLPVIDDIDEATHIYGYLCDMIEGNNPLILGQNNSNLPTILAIIADAFFNGVILATSPVACRLLVIVKHIQANSEIFDVCIKRLSEEQKHAIEDAFREAATSTSTTTTPPTTIAPTTTTTGAPNTNDIALGGGGGGSGNNGDGGGGGASGLTNFNVTT